MAIPGGSFYTVAELSEFATFGREEQRFIESSLDIAFERVGARELARQMRHAAALRARCSAYRELHALRDAVPGGSSFASVGAFMGPLVRISGQDLAFGSIASFAAYRFLYERLLGAAARPWLPAAFCGAAALPMISPDRRRLLLASLTESAVTAPAWSASEPRFYPRGLDTRVAENHAL